MPRDATSYRKRFAQRVDGTRYIGELLGIETKYDNPFFGDFRKLFQRKRGTKFGPKMHRKTYAVFVMAKKLETQAGLDERQMGDPRKSQIGQRSKPVANPQQIVSFERRIDFLENPRTLANSHPNETPVVVEFLGELVSRDGTLQVHAAVDIERIQDCIRC